jgi:hypothetical protein
MRLVLAAALAATPVTAALAQNQRGGQQKAAGRPAGLTVPVNGTVGPVGAPGTPLTGTFTIQRFATSGSDVVAVGTLVASFDDPTTNAPRTIVTQASIPLDRTASGGEAAPTGAAADAEAAIEGAIGEEALRGPAVAAQQACDILNLVLGPLDLNLLGLRIQLNQVELDITAVPGAGNLLGNLLCAVAGLLDGPGPLQQLVSFLNQLLAILG